MAEDRLKNVFSGANVKSNLHYTRGITLKRVTSGGLIFSALRLGYTVSKKHRWTGESPASLCPI